MKKILLNIWQLPQHILAWVILLLLRNRISETLKYNGLTYYFSPKIPGAVSLGDYIFINSRMSNRDWTMKHEYGHSIQSRILGPLYLIVIGLPSFIHATRYTLNPKLSNYYSFYTEKWANKIVDITPSQKIKKV